MKSLYCTFYCLIIMMCVIPLISGRTMYNTLCKDTIENDMKGKGSKDLTSREDSGEPYNCIVCSTADDAKCFNYTGKEDKNCPKISSTSAGRIPLYNNLLEFRLEIFSFVKAYASIKLSGDCYLNIQIYYNFKDSNGYVEVRECTVKDENKEFDAACDKEAKLRSDTSLYALCAGVALGVVSAEASKVYYASVFHCYDVPSKQLNYQDPLTLKKCKFAPNAASKIPSVRFRFTQEHDLHKDEVGVQPIGVPIMLPCSPGGHVVSAFSGKFFSGSSCEKLYNFVDSSATNGISFIIKTFYGGKENLKFPTKDYSKSTDKLPIYMNEDNSAKAVDAVKYSESGSNKKREICKLS